MHAQWFRTPAPQKLLVATVPSNSEYARQLTGRQCFWASPPPSPHVEMGWLWRCSRVPISLADALALAVAALCWFIFNEPVSVLVA